MVKYRVFFVLEIIALMIGSAGCSKAKKQSMGPDEDSHLVIIAFGDSLTAGFGVEPENNYPALLQAKLEASGYRHRVINAGINGETSAEGLQRVQDMRSLNPAIVIVELGANDGLRGLPIDVMRRNLDTIVSQFQSMGAKVILAGMEVPPHYGPLYSRSFRKAFPAIAKEHDVPLISFFLDGVGGHPDLNQADGIHPTAEGYRIVVENVWKVLEPVL
jgi:acyl-CoA thioesterase-1